VKPIDLREHAVGSNIRTYPHYYSKGYSLFKKKPRLDIKESLASVSIPLEVKTPTKSDESTFNAIIWSLRISNTRWPRISATALKSSAKLHIKDVGTEIPLRWNTRILQPQECTLDTSVRQGDSATDHYHKLMPYYYAVVELASKYGQPVADIYQGEESSLYLLFTCEGSKRAFIITPIRFPEWYGNEVYYPNVGDRFLFINQGEEHEWITRIENNPFKARDGSTRHEYTSYMKFRIKFNSWDNIKII
jgi:hypothetical protein